jgi:O-6-methylguanine DNA methyltransferase
MRYAVMSTPLGELTLASNGGVLTSIHFGSRIPPGHVSYVAAHSVGMARHDNRIPIVVPCHRVVGRDGSLTGYARGLHFKQQLLALETRTRCL